MREDSVSMEQDMLLKRNIREQTKLGRIKHKHQKLKIKWGRKTKFRDSDKE